MKRRLFKAIVTSAIAVFGITASSQDAEAIQLQKLPNRPDWRGFFHSHLKDNYKQLPLDIPYDIAFGYIVADGSAYNSPGYGVLNEIFGKIGWDSDTMAYILKYLYRLVDYDPIRFQNFLWRVPRPNYGETGATILGALYSRLSGDKRIYYIAPFYILHVKVNAIEFIDTVDKVFNPNIIESETIVYCKVLDTLKGQVLPDLNNAILSNGKNEFDKNVMQFMAVPQKIDFVFSYNNRWSRVPSPNYVPLLDEVNGTWIKSNKEYIIFVRPISMTGTNTTSYYSICPMRIGLSYGMFPIDDGFVIDEGNSMEWGEKVPIDEFKKHIIEQINLIKNYGE